jgi:maltooligosyltrehalose trehalohydrolase
MVSFEQLKLSAGVVLLSPFIPLLFMGEEYGETAPFRYFIDHSDAALLEAVRRGRRDEFTHFGLEGDMPDPAAETTFLNSKIHPELRSRGEHRILFEFYKDLIRLRKEIPAHRLLSKDDLDVVIFEAERTLFVRRWSERDEVFGLYNFSGQDKEISLTLPGGRWSKVLESSEGTWGGKGAVAEPLIDSCPTQMSIPIRAHSFVLYRRPGR